MTRIPDPLLKIGYNLLFTAGFALTWPYFTYLIWRRNRSGNGWESVWAIIPRR